MLLAEGHSEARRYTIGMVRNEATVARARVNARIATEAVMLHSAVASIIGGGNGFETSLKELNGG